MERAREAGTELVGKAKEHAIAEFLRWYEGERHKVCELVFEGSPIAKFLAGRHVAGSGRRGYGRNRHLLK